MIIPKESLSYLTGEKFSNGLVFHLGQDLVPMMDKITWLETRVRGKRVLDVGCVDHNVETIASKHEEGIWVHGRLRKVASFCMGIDICSEGVEYIKNVLNFSDVLCGDVFDLSTIINRSNFDSIVMGDVLEHLDSPVLFLTRMREIYGAKVKEILISVPNAFKWENFIYGLSNKEVINSDHRYWYTPYTLSKVCLQAGWSIRDIKMVTDYALPRHTTKDRIADFFLEKYPILRGVVTAQLYLA